MSNRPIKTFSSTISPYVKLAIWQGEKGLSMTISKSYKDKDGEWKDSSIFFADDLAAIERLIPRAINFCDKLQADRRAAQEQQRQASAPPPNDDDPPF